MPQAGPDMALLGHDIRSAVSDVLGGLRLIEPDALPGQARLQVSRARAAAETLARLLDTVLQDSAMGEVGASFATGVGDTPLLELLEDAERRWTAHASEMGLALHMTRGPGLPGVIGVDRTALERILSNLLSNAMKHAGLGRVRFETCLWADRTLVFSVRDEGPGFAPEVLDQLYGRGVRGHGDRRSGQGMGLHICKDLADQMGGTLEVESGPDGALVRLLLPPGAWQLSGLDGAGEPVCDLSGAQVLLVEDSPTNQTLMRQMLSRMGARVTIAGNGRAALEAWRSGGHDFALIDIELPEISGLEVIREIRASAGVAGRLPILAVTAYVLRSNREAIFSAGADGVLAKPLNSFEAFSRAVAGLLRRTGPLAQDMRARPQPEPGMEGADALYDRHVLRHLLGIAGPQGAQELMGRLKADLRTAQRELADGLLREDMPVVRAKTHVLISLAGAIGARLAQKEAERMNDAAHRRDTAVLSALGPTALRRLEDLIAAIDAEKVEVAQ